MLSFWCFRTGVTDVVSEGDTGIDESIIATMFTFFRIIVVPAFCDWVVVVLTQAFRVMILHQSPTCLVLV